jgi:hypothetical protein
MRYSDNEQLDGTNAASLNDANDHNDHRMQWRTWNVIRAIVTPTLWFASTATDWRRRSPRVYALCHMR